jgi:hypothetical protein
LLESDKEREKKERTPLVGEVCEVIAVLINRQTIMRKASKQNVE